MDYPGKNIGDVLLLGCPRNDKMSDGKGLVSNAVLSYNCDNGLIAERDSMGSGVALYCG